MDRTYIPAAERLGAKVLAGHEVRSIEVRGERAVAVRARDAEGNAVVASARRGVVLAASAVQSPCILQRSGIGPRAHVGAHFRAHPGTGVIGVYEEPVRIWEGATQSYEVDHFRAQAGFKMETVGLPLELAGVRVPGFGAEFARRMAEFPHMAMWGVQVRAEAEGTVRDAGDRARIAYTPLRGDMELFRRGVRALAELHFAAGATHLYPGVHGGPDILARGDDLSELDRLPLDPRAYGMIAAHVFGTCRMAKEARDGAVDPRFAVHGTQGLWVVDASIFPTNLGVNPQHTIMALAMLAAEQIASAPPA
jgi:choline dehydrogenase-like flavoprotein